MVAAACGVALLAPRPAPFTYLPTAPVGNGRLLAGIDSRGRLASLYWPHPGSIPWVREPLRVWGPPGLVVGVQTGKGLVWLHQLSPVSQRYLPGTAVLVTRWDLPGGGSVEFHDFVPQHSDALVRRIVLSRNNTAPSSRPKQAVTPGVSKGAACPPWRILIWQDIDPGCSLAAGRLRIRDGILTQWRSSPDAALALAASQPPEQTHVGPQRSWLNVRRGRLNGRTDGATPAGAALCFRPLRSLTLALCPDRTPSGASRQAQTLVRSDCSALERQAAAYWRRWLAGGWNPPLSSDRDRELWQRSLVTLKLLQDVRTGACVAGVRPGWCYVWPRDAAWAAVALDTCGYHAEAASALRFLARVQRPDGLWHARSLPDGRPVADGRASQLDAPGHFLWALWVHWRLSGDVRLVRDLRPAAWRAADACERSLSPATGLPGPSADYWEQSTDPSFYLSNALVCRTGLVAASALAENPAEASQRLRAAARVGQGIGRHLAVGGRFLRSSGAQRGQDSAACWAVAPFALPLVDNAVTLSLSKGDGALSHDAPAARAAVLRAAEAMGQPDGGYSPGEDWRRGESWVPETLFFGLAFACGADRPRAVRALSFVSSLATAPGLLPERVRRPGEVSATTPLAWSHSLWLLTQSALHGHPLSSPVTSVHGRGR